LGREGKIIQRETTRGYKLIRERTTGKENNTKEGKPHKGKTQGRSTERAQLQTGLKK